MNNQIGTKQLDRGIVLTVNENDREAINDIVAEINYTQTKDTQDNEQLQALFSALDKLPTHITRELEKFRKKDFPFMRVKGLPNNKESEVLLMLTSILGMPFAHSEEAELVSVVKPKKAHSMSSNPSYFTATKFDLHSELPYITNPPDYLSLLCKYNVEDGYTYTSTISSALALLDGETIQILSEPIFQIMIPPHFGQVEKYARERPIISPYGDNFRVQIRFDKLKYPEYAGAAIKQLYEAVNKVRIEHLLSPGELLVINNNLSLHGRSAFNPTYSQQDRQLFRVYTIRDSYKLLSNFHFDEKRISGF